MRMHACVREHSAHSGGFRGLSLVWMAGLVLDDLEVSPFLRSIHLSEELGIEKPHSEIFRLALRDATPQGQITRADECVHVGDELYW